MEHAPNTFRDFGSQLLSLAAYQSVLCGTSPLQLEHINFARTAHARVESSPANDTVYVRMCMCIFVRVGVCVCARACVRKRRKTTSNTCEQKTEAAAAAAAEAHFQVKTNALDVLSSS